MTELWDVYDINRKKTGKIIKRGIDKLTKGEYHIVVTAVIINSKNEIFISKRSASKETNPLKWECNGGSILCGETSWQGMLREIKEEIGLVLNEKEGLLLKTIIKEEKSPKIKDVWLLKKDFKIEDLEFTDGEVIEAKWVTIEEYTKMLNEGEIVKSVDFNKDDYNKIIQK